MTKRGAPKKPEPVQRRHAVHTYFDDHEIRLFKEEAKRLRAKLAPTVAACALAGLVSLERLKPCR